MSGHSKWSKIKRQKGAQDQKKGNLFTKLGQAITLAVREGGGDPDMNSVLRLAIEKAKEANMPKETINKAIERGLGKGDTGNLESVTYEVSGGQGIAILLDCLTDNKNRTLTEIRRALSKTDYSVSSGSLKWQFDRKGLISITLKSKDGVNIEEVMLQLMDLPNVEDVVNTGDKGTNKGINVYVPKQEFRKTYEEIQKMQYEILDAGITWVPKSKIRVEAKTKKKVSELIIELGDIEDVERICHNVSLK